MSKKKASLGTVKIWLAVALVSLCLWPAMAGCSSGASPSSATQPAASTTQPPTAPPTAKIMVDPAQAQTLINQNQGSSAFSILDVRTAEEFASGHLPGAADIDIYQASFQNKVSQLDRHKTYLVYCLTGIRSAQAAQIMLNLGFPAIYDLRGGITQWIQAGMSVVK